MSADREGIGGELRAPDATYTRHRWVQRRHVDWVEQADEIMLEHGAVEGRQLCEKRHHARWRAQRLIRLMVDLGLHERWELAEHTEYRKGATDAQPSGWVWIVEYKGAPDET